MFKSKADVDKHVGRILNRLKSQTEINRECLKIARFYFDIGEYESAKVYLVNYLSDNTQDAVAWELMGDLIELNEKNWPKAIENYTECLKLSETQNKKVLLKICKCYLNLDDKKLAESVKTARKWLDKTEVYYPFDKTVIELKEKLINFLIESISSSSAHSVTSSPSSEPSTSRECMLLKDEWETFLLKALDQSPSDRNLNLKLIKAYLSFKQPALSVPANTYLLKAIKKILANELNCTFNENNLPTSIQYYQTLLATVQSEQDKVESSAHLKAVEVLLLKQSMLLHLKSTTFGSDGWLLLQSLFTQYNKCVFELEATIINKGRHSDAEIFRYLLDEHRAFVYYLTGLLLLRLDSTSSSSTEQEKLLLNRVFNGSTDDLSDDGFSTTGHDVLLLSNEETKLLTNSAQVLASVCFVISLNKSKPCSELTARIEHQIGDAKQQPPEMASVHSLFAKCINRDSAWRYSVISHWLKFKLRSNKDKLCFFNTLCELTTNESLIKEAIFRKLKLFDKDQEGDKLARSSLDHNLDEFRLSKNQLVNFDASTIYSIVDQKSLEYSNKIILTNQNSNLAYLVWFNVSNSVQKNSNLISPLNKPITKTLIFPYFVLSHSQKSTKKIQYGVENLNLCNTESLSLIDIKLFIYSSALQAFSYLNDDLMPYWIQSNLCSSYQYNWWSRAVNYLFKPFTTTKRNEQQLCLNKLIELVRLKSSTIQLTECGDAEGERSISLSESSAAASNNKTSSGGKPETYKQNLIVTIKLALYLQYLVNSLANKFKSTKIKYNSSAGETGGDETSAAFIGGGGATGNIFTESMSDDTSDESLLLDSLINNECELEYSPQQKLDYLRRYQLQYWAFVCKELIKLKQIRGACSDNDDNLTDDQLSEANNALLFPLSEYDFDNDNPGSLHQKAAKNYFNYSFQHLNEPAKKHLSELNENLLIQTGLLELILDNMHKLQIEQMSNESFDQDFVGVKSQLEVALTRFELIDVNLSDTDLNNYQLQLCKKIGEEAVKQRDIYAKVIETTRATDPAKCAAFIELLNKVNCLIEYLKKKFKKNFVNKKAQICNEINTDQLHILNKFEILKNFSENDAHALCNLSISEWLKQNDPLSQLDDFEEMNKEMNLELKQIQEVDEEAEEKSANEVAAKELKAEFLEPKSPSFSDLRTPLRPEGLVSTRHVQEAENAFDDVDLDKSLGSMVVPTRIDFEADVQPEPAVPVPVPVAVQVPTPTVTETQQRDDAADALRTQTIAEIKQTNDKISQLIKTLATERTEKRFRFNKDILKEQFVTVNFQYMQMNQEIKTLSEVCANRKKILTDFRQVVDSMNVLYDMEAFNQQFKIYFWLFQNQPNYIEQYMNSQYAAKAVEEQKNHLQDNNSTFSASFDQTTPKKAANSYDESFSGRSNTLESNKTLGTSFNASQSILVEQKTSQEVALKPTEPVREDVERSQPGANVSGKQMMEKSLDQTDQSYSLNDNYGTPQQTHGSLTSFSNLPNNAINATESPQKTSQLYLSKPIGELNFKSNDNESNLFEQMKNSINLYKLDKQANEEEDVDENEYVLGTHEMEDYNNFEDEYQNEYDYCGDAIVAGNLRRSDAVAHFGDPTTDQEEADGTFLSCSNNNTNKAEESNQASHRLSKSASESNSKSSISELNILFQNDCQVFDCHFEANQAAQTFAERDFRWTSKNKCTVQIIGDEISDRDNFQAYMFISETAGGKTIQYDLHHGIHLKKFSANQAASASIFSCFLYSSASLNEFKSKTMAFEFDSEALMNEFESSIAELKSKLLKHGKSFSQPTPTADVDAIVSSIAKKPPAFASSEKASPLKQLFNLTQSL